MEFKNQAQLFNHIWETREHISELSGKPLLPKGHLMWHWQFLHILPKGTYPKFKLLPKNIILALPDEHERQEQFEKFIERRDKLKREYYKEFYKKIF
jgi:hypothetical protein